MSKTSRSKTNMGLARKQDGLRMPELRLTDQEEAFVEHYALNLNGAEAYRKAFPDRATGKSDQYIAEQASKFRRKSKIQARIRQLRTRASEIAERRFDIEIDKVLQGLAAIAFASIEDVLAFDEAGNPMIDLTKADRVTLRGFAAIKIKRTERVLTAEETVAAETKATDLETGLVSSESVRKPRVRAVLTEVEVKLPDRTAALTKLGQHLRIFQEDNSTNFTINIADRMTRAIEQAKTARRANSTASKLKLADAPASDLNRSSQ